MSTATPDREQALNALALANHVRTTNARFLDGIREMSHPDGCRAVAAALLDGDMKGPAGAIATHRLLKAVRWLSRIRIETLLSGAGIYQSDRPLRRLTTRQRCLLAGALNALAASSRARS
jgi:hypothetical protein